MDHPFSMSVMACFDFELGTIGIGSEETNED